MSEWQTFCLKDLGKIVGGATPPTNNPKNYGNKIRWITAKDLSTLQGRYIKKGSRSISRLGFKSCSTFLLPKHAILFSVRAPIGYTAIISKRSCTDRGLMGLVPNKKIYFEFLYYLLKYHKDNISNMGVGTTFKGISKLALGLFKVKIPPTYYEQQKIAHTLSILDQKIENNHKINELLHKILELLYEQYFVRFDFLDENNKPYQTSGGKMKFSKELNRLIPNDFEVKTLGELVDIFSGYSFQSNTYSNNKNDYILITLTGHIGRCALVFSKNCILNQRVGVVLPKEKELNPFYYSLIRNPLFSAILQRNAIGSSQQNLSPIDTLKIQIPFNHKIIKQYSKTCENIIKLLVSNMQSTQTLTALRDFLLPLLLKQQVKPQ
ncbi:restriction endonuclease subunit S [Helicobacter pylori]|nr:restriction endonuclease subunit S [Helicobacter pylori]